MIKSNAILVKNLIELALSLKQKGDLVNSKIQLKKALKIDPENIFALNNLGSIYSATNRPNEAKKFYKKAISFKSNYSNAIFNLALTYEETGNTQKAIDLYKKAIEYDDKNLGFYHNLYRVNADYFNENKIKNIEKILKEEKLSDFNIASGNFILAYHQRKKKNFEKEFYYLFEAHKFLHISNEKINNQISFYWIRLLPKLIKKITTISNKKKNIKIKPIFIVGLPRSGSTLVESIISSGKKKLQIGGETSILNRVFLEENSNFLSKKEFLEENKEMKINIDSFNENSLKKYELLNLLDKETNYIFTDKSLENFFFIELIIKIFPEAKIINCERNIFQIIISIYQNFLSNIKWSNSIDNILEYIDNYLKIISEFKKKYPKHIYNIDLDKLTKNSQKESKALFKFCNLDWDLKCLEFYKRKDLISKTASNQQVRNKIFINEKKYTEYKVFFKPYADKYAWLEKIIQPNKENN